MAQSAGFLSVIALRRNHQIPLEPLIHHLHSNAAKLFSYFEILIIDCGEHTVFFEEQAALERLLSQLSSLRYLRLSKDFGVQAAISAGFDYVIGDTICCLELGRDPVEALPALLHSQRSSLQPLVLGRVAKNTLSRSERLLRMIFYRFCRSLLGIAMAEYATTLMVVNRQSLNQLNSIKDTSRHYKAYAFIAGMPFAYFDYERLPEQRRESLLKKIDLALNFIFNYSSRPLRWASVVALSLGAFNLLYVFYIALIVLFKQKISEGWVTLSVQGALNFFVLSMLAAVAVEYLWRTVDESRKRPHYFISCDRKSEQLLSNLQHIRNVVTPQNRISP